MIEIYPKLSSSFSRCPACGCQLSSPTSLLFSGRYILADIECTCCDVPYYHSYPAKDKDDPSCFAFTKDGKHITFKSRLNKWNVRLLKNALNGRQKTKCIFEIEKRNTSDTVAIVNFIGLSQQSIMELTSKIQLELKDLSQYIFLVSDHFKYLVPDSVAEIWSLKNNRNNNKFAIPDLDEFIKSQLSRFKQVSLYDTDSLLPVKNNVSLINKILMLFG